MDAEKLPEGCPTCGALPCDWAGSSLNLPALDNEGLVCTLSDLMRADPFCDDAPLIGTTQQDMRMEHYARQIAPAILALAEERDRADARVAELEALLDSARLSILCAAGVNDDATDDEADSEVMSWGGSAMSVTFGEIQSALGKDQS